MSAPSASLSTTPARRRLRPSGRLAALVLAAILLPLTAIATATAEPVPNPPPGVGITVNGLPMTGEDGKIEGCTLAIAVDGLDPEAGSTIGVVVKAVAPTAPEGQPAALVDQQAVAEGSGWSTDLVMDDLVAPFPAKPNGYHLRVSVSIDDVLAGSAVYWLACGEAQQGNPTRILFAVQWQGNDGSTTDVAPGSRLPAGWRGPLRIDGLSKKGTAVCTFPGDATQLVCEYDNPGHGDQPGLVVPGSPKAIYDVAATGVPAGWSVDPTTVGTFVGRETCPRGDDHDHGELAALEGGDHTCTHLVRLVEDPAPPITPTTPTTAAALPAASSTAPSAAVEGEQIATGTLPATGSSSSLLLTGLGSALVVAGAAAVALSARARRAPAPVPVRSFEHLRLHD